MFRILIISSLLVVSTAACGSDDDSSSGTDGSATTVVSDESAAPTPSTPSSAGASSTTVAAADDDDATAAALLLTPQDLAGWTEAQDDDSGTDFDTDAPECADLKSLDALDESTQDADVTLLSPDGGTQLQEDVTVGDPAALQQGFALLSGPNTAACLQTLFTGILQQPGQLEDGVTLDGVQFAQQPLVAGDSAVSFVGTVTLSGPAATAGVGIRFDVVQGQAGVATLVTLTAPGAAPVDAAAVATAAGQKLAAA